MKPTKGISLLNISRIFAKTYKKVVIKNIFEKCFKNIGIVSINSDIFSKYRLLPSDATNRLFLGQIESDNENSSDNKNEEGGGYFI